MWGGFMCTAAVLGADGAPRHGAASPGRARTRQDGGWRLNRLWLAAQLGGVRHETKTVAYPSAMLALGSYSLVLANLRSGHSF
jgi:hypothetical protein